MYRNEGTYPRGGAESLWMWKNWAERHNHEKFLGFMGNGEAWQKSRFALQEDIISPKVARSYLPLISEACTHAAGNFASFAERPDRFATYLAFDMFCAALYGLQMKTAAGQARPQDLAFVENTVSLFTLMGTLLFSGHLKMGIFKRHPLNQEFQRRADLSTKMSVELLEEALQRARTLGEGDCQPYVAKAIAPGKMTVEEFKEQGITLLLAGVDTTQSVMNWNLVHLARNPEVQERLREEVVSVFGRQGILRVEPFEKLRSQLPYLKAVVREAHRMTPASPVMTARQAPCDLELSGFEVPKGTRVNFNVLGWQNDARYVEEPERFMPERWLDAAVRARKGTEAEILDHKLLSTPFSFGARMCLGGRVAELETYAMLCHLVREWRFEIAEGAAPWVVTSPLMTKASPFPAFAMERL